MTGRIFWRSWDVSPPRSTGPSDAQSNTRGPALPPWALLQRFCRAAPKTAVEPTPLLPSDDITPMWIRHAEHGPLSECQSVSRRLFQPVEVSDPEDMNSMVISPRLPAESPRAESPVIA